MKICKKGKEESSIIVSPVASEIEQFAAKELQKYIQKISGVKLPILSKKSKVPQNILLYCGEDADKWWNSKPVSKYKEDSFAIKSTGNQLYLLGQNGRGLLYAVYSFLEDELGVGFLAPGEENEWIPEKKTININSFSRIEEPSMRLRGFSCNLPEEIDWMAKNKMNYILADENVISMIFNEARKRQMLLYAAGHSFYRWLPPGKYWKSHPEYYSLLNGKRTCTYQQGEHMGHQQICVSNPDVIRIVSENIIRFIEKHPEYDFYTLWPNDADSWCQCKNCRKLDGKGKSSPGKFNNAGSYIYFANKVAERVSNHHPKKKLNIIAYRSTMVPPSDPKISLHPNIALEVAYWGRPCDQPVGQPLTDDEIKRRMKRADIEMKNFDVWKNHYLSYGKILKRWSRIVKGDLLIYDYMMASQSTLSLPYPMFGTIQEDHKFYRKIGATGCYMQAHKNNCTAYGLNYRMGAKAYWGGPQDVEKQLDEYCQKRFGQGASSMKKYFHILEKSFRSQTCSFAPYTVSRILQPEVVKKCQKALKIAQSLIKKNSQKGWFNKTNLHFEYSCRMKLYYDVCKKTGFYIDKGKEEKAFQSLMEVYKKTIELYEHIIKLKGQDIISTPRVVLYSLLKQEGKRHGDTPLASIESAEKITEYLWQKLYDSQGW